MPQYVMTYFTLKDYLAVVQQANYFIMMTEEESDRQRRMSERVKHVSC